MYSNWICQTFWTKPMSEKDVLCNAKIAQISLYYAHRSGYFVRMYTDDKGFEILKDFGYDDISLKLNDIPNDISTRLFAYPKSIALSNEPLGVVHTDYDVFLKKPCIDAFFEGNYDVVLQHIEDENQIKCEGYVNAYKILNNYGVFNGFHLEHTTPSNVGVIGFNNQKLKDEYLNLYQKCVDFYKVTINDYKENKLFIPDLYFEQININWLISEKKYNAMYLLPRLNYGDFNLHKIAKEIGYQHLIGSWKYSENGREFLDTFLDGLGINKKSQLKIIWASSGIGKSYLALHDERFIDLDKIASEYFETHELFEYWEISLYQAIKEKYQNTDKIILCSNLDLLSIFSNDMFKIFSLPKEKMFERLIERGELKNMSQENIIKWCDDTESLTNQIKKNKDVIEIDDYLSNHVDELLK